MNNKQQNCFEIVDANLFKQWSIHLALFLNQSETNIEAILHQLLKAYQSRTIKTRLNIINKFSYFPGYPFIISGTFVEHINYVCHSLNLAVTKEIPKIPIFAFQKSASSYISVVLCHLFDILPTVLSYEHQIGMSAWANAFSKWGGIIHDHYHPNTSNLKILYKAGIKKCIIHYRHPVNTLISYAFHMVNRTLYIDKEKLTNEAERIALVRDYLNQNMEMILCRYSSWLRAWRKEGASGQMEILETTYEDMITDQKMYFARILAFNHINYNESSLEHVLHELRRQRTNNSYNIRKASPNEWQEILTPQQVKRVKRIVDKQFQGEFTNIF